ncbi:MAG: T9SS type A sorting domain-containing protein [Melioribacteraceae bacterium]|nr:T9SS type A sorting domain-containing protein [Melioribacteraceae bacterium]
MVEEDRSLGMHNPEFAVELLKLTIGVVKGEISDVAPEDGQIPVRFELAQNYPNPFNPSTTINFSIPKASDVTLTIYDALGREVARLVDEQRAPGTYSVDWNAGNQASGIYFYRIATEQNVQVKKMVLVK